MLLTPEMDTVSITNMYYEAHPQKIHHWSLFHLVQCHLICKIWGFSWQWRFKSVSSGCDAE